MIYPSVLEIYGYIGLEIMMVIQYGFEVGLEFAKRHLPVSRARGFLDLEAEYCLFILKYMTSILSTLVLDLCEP